MDIVHRVRRHAPLEFFFTFTCSNVQRSMGDIHLGKGSSHKLVARHLNFFSQIGLSTKKANPKDQRD